MRLLCSLARRRVPERRREPAHAGTVARVQAILSRLDDVATWDHVVREWPEYQRARAALVELLRAVRGE